MQFEFVNDWHHPDLGFIIPEPFAVFNCTWCLVNAGGEFNIVILGLGFAFCWGQTDEDEDTIS